MFRYTHPLARLVFPIACGTNANFQGGVAGRNGSAEMGAEDAKAARAREETSSRPKTLPFDVPHQRSPKYPGKRKTARRTQGEYARIRSSFLRRIDGETKFR